MIPDKTHSLAEQMRDEHAVRKRIGEMLKANSRSYCHRRSLRNILRMGEVRLLSRAEKEAERKLAEIQYLPQEEYVARLIGLSPAEPLPTKKGKSRGGKHRPCSTPMFGKRTF